MNESSILGRNKWLYYGSGGMILKFPVHEKMHNGSLGVGEFGSNTRIKTAFKGQTRRIAYL